MNRSPGRAIGQAGAILRCRSRDTRRARLCFRVEAEWRDLTGSATDRAANAEAVVRALLAA